MRYSAMTIYPDERLDDIENLIYDDSKLCDWAFEHDIDIRAFCYSLCESKSNANSVFWMVDHSNVRDFTNAIPADKMAVLIRNFMQAYPSVKDDFINFASSNM